MSTHTAPRVIRTVSPLEVTASMVASEFYVPLSQAHDMLRETDLTGSTWTREVGDTRVHLDSNGLEVTALSAYPILSARIADGSVWQDGHLYACRATDGVQMYLPGSVERPDQSEAYLTDFPTPDRW